MPLFEVTVLKVVDRIEKVQLVAVNEDDARATVEAMLDLGEVVFDPQTEDGEIKVTDVRLVE